MIVAALLMMVALDQFVRRSRLGRGIRAVAQDPESAALMGVNSTRVVQLTFLLGGLMAGAAATLYMIRIGATRFDAGFILGVKAFTAAVMGGIGNLRGALLGGLVLGVAENYGSAHLRHPVEGRRGVRPAGRDPAVPTDRPAGRVARKGTRMSTTADKAGATSETGAKRSFRDRVDGAAPQRRRSASWSLAALFFYALPLLRAAVHLHPGHRLRRRAVHRLASTSLVALGLNIVVGYAGLLDLGYVGFYAIGAYTVGGAHLRARQLAVLRWPSRSRSR